MYSLLLPRKGDKKPSSGTISRSTSTATTVPGDDEEAKRMAAENNAIRLAEIQQEQTKRKASAAPPDKPETQPANKLPRANSTPIFESKPASTEKELHKAAPSSSKANSKKGKKQQKAHRKRGNHGKNASKSRKKAKKANLKKKKCATEAIPKTSHEPPAPITHVPVVEPQNQNEAQQKAQQIAAEQKAQQHMVPVKAEVGQAAPVPATPQQVAAMATPAKAADKPVTEQDAKAAEASRYIQAMLNRSQTSDLHSPSAGPDSTTPSPNEPETDTSQPSTTNGKKPAKPRDLERHARKNRFYRSLDSHSLSERTYHHLLLAFILLA